MLARWREIIILLVLAGTAVSALAVWQRANLGITGRWRWLAVLPLLGGIGLAVLLVAYVSSQQASQWIHPVRDTNIGMPESVGINQWEDVELETSDGLKLVGWFIPATDGDGATVIHVHGLSGNRSANLSAAATLAAAGYNSLLFDLRNHGASDGDVTTLGYSEIEDVRAALDYVLARPDVDAEKIVIKGHSLGAVVAIRAAATMSEFKALISESGFASIESSWEEIIRALTGGMQPAPLVNMFVDQQTGVPVSQLSFIDELAQVAPRPVLFVHGEIDDVINVSHSQRMYEAASEPKTLCLIPNAGHIDYNTVDPERYNTCVLDFLDTHLQG